MKIGGILDINLNKGVLIVNRIEHITVGLIASKESKLLKDCVSKFSIDFEDKFKRILKKSIVDMNAYKTADELIMKYFSNFSTKFIKDKKTPLYLLDDQFEPLKSIDNKIKNIFQDVDEYRLIVEDLVKAPINYSSEFIDLYEELKDETDEIIYNDNRKTDLDYLDFRKE